MNVTTQLKDNLNTFEQYSSELSATNLNVILRQRREVRVGYMKKLCNFWRVASELTKIIKKQGWIYSETELYQLVDKVDDDLDSVEKALQDLEGTHSSVLNTLKKLHQRLERLLSLLSHIEIELFDDRVSKFCPEVIPQERRIQAKEALSGSYM